MLRAGTWRLSIAGRRATSIDCRHWWPIWLVRQVAVIAMAGSTSGGTRGTGTIPIVFSIAGDPVQLGLVANLNRPGGNLTGMTIWNAELVPKRLELLRPSPYGDEQTRPARLLRRKRQDMRRRYRALSG